MVIIQFPIFMYPGLRYADKKKTKRKQISRKQQYKNKLLFQENNRIKEQLLFKSLTSKTLGHCWNIKK